MALRFSYLLALGIASGVGLWMASGKVVIGGAGESSPPSPAEQLKNISNKPIAVRVASFHAQPREAKLEVRGRTEADVKVVVRAETTAVVRKRFVNEGDLVEKGDLLCVLDEGARAARVLHANALLAQAELDYQASTKLNNKGFTAQNKVAALKASRDAAKAQLQEVELELDKTEIRSPGRGIVESPMVEVGSMLQAGQPCATIIDFDPMLVIGTVSERDINNVYIGQEAQVSLVTGEQLSGSVRYIAPAANPDMRTFRVEIEISNETGKIRDGITATANLIKPIQTAHFISPGILTLNDNGEIGVRAVSDENKVLFYPVAIEGGTTEGVWVKGLPDELQVIVVGQDFVLEGQTVKPMPVELEVGS
ncbi:efflux RND transporter periplasmic adaptor subunit [Flexibacterium corallicola]|uniref:efflux RND transporter periplasmic adaptor subunit n=1 Tax=Flexibacterium corallicola TaxID=3037259 RepID=UPI00286EB7E7|nr:efflux RND transporter periplasmic adaptor subunit [Pseudovibrio sp. M1P-2-3]